jgi:hypothetical protein
MGGSFVTVMVAAIRLVRLLAGAVVRAAVTSAASTVTGILSIVAMAVGVVGSTITAAIIIVVVARWAASAA